MAYATPADIVALHGQRTLDALADRDDDGEVDTSAVEAALAGASAEIDTYLSMRYPTPLPTTPPIVKIAAVEIATYRLANNGLGLSEDLRKRYEDMIQRMKDIAAGKANLGIPALDNGAGQGDDDWKVPVAAFGMNSR